MGKPDFTSACPRATAEMPHGVDRQALVSEDHGRREEKIGTEFESFVAGGVVDSWVAATWLQLTRQSRGGSPMSTVFARQDRDQSGNSIQFFCFYRCNVLDSSPTHP